MSMACILLALTLASIADALAVTSSGLRKQFYFESHGRDDLREWPATILKGAQYIKIDFNFQTNPEVCRNQTRVAAQAKNLNFPNGCFVLVHTFFGGTVDYNTTEDIVAFLSDPANLPLWEHGPIIFQMCLKLKPPLCPGDLQAQKWVALMDDFYDAAQPVLEKLSGKVQFVFDSLDPVDCDNTKHWPRWNSTYVGSPLSEATDFQDRHRMVNMPKSNMTIWDELASVNFGKFRNDSYSMVYWEPSNEFEFHDFANHFMSYNYVHQPGVLAAINADPGIFHVFTADDTSRYSHTPFSDMGNTNPVTCYLPSMKWLVTVSKVDFQSKLSFALHQRGPQGTFSKAFYGFFQGVDSNVTEGFLTDLHASWNGSAFDMLIAGDRCVQNVILSGPETFKVLSVGKVLCLNTSAGALSLAFFSNTTMLLASSAHKGQMIVSLYQVTLAHNGSAATIVASMSVPVGVVNDGVACAIQRTHNKYVGIVTWAINRAVFVLSIEGTVGSSVMQTTGPLMLGVGRHPSIAFANAENDTTFLITYGHSYCFNSQMVDDDAFIMLGEKICNMNNKTVFELFENPVQAYSFGKWEKLQEVLGTTHNVPRNGFASSCSTNVFHGIFDLGFNANAALLPKEDTDFDILPGGYLAVVALESITIPTLSSCGNPVPHFGKLLIDSFPLMGFYNSSLVDS